MSPTGWASASPNVIESIMGILARRDPYGHAAIQADLAAGGRLRLVIDQPAGIGSVRVRVRLLSELGRNRWIYGREVAVEPPRPRVVG
jgi:hypothetical protein